MYMRAGLISSRCGYPGVRWNSGVQFHVLVDTPVFSQYSSPSIWDCDEVPR